MQTVHQGHHHRHREQYARPWGALRIQPGMLLHRALGARWVLRQSEQFLLGARRSAQNRVLAWERLGLLVVRSLEQPARSVVSWSFRASGIAGERAEAPTMRRIPVEQSQDSGSRA